MNTFGPDLGPPDRPAALGAMKLGAIHTGLDTLADHRPFELGKHGEHLEQRAAYAGLLRNSSVNASGQK